MYHPSVKCYELIINHLGEKHDHNLRKWAKQQGRKDFFFLLSSRKKNISSEVHSLSVTENLWPVKLTDHIVFTCM